MSDYQRLLWPLPDALHGERVMLRSLRPTDGGAMAIAIDESRLELSPFLPWQKGMRTDDDAIAFCTREAARWLLREHLTFGVFDRIGGGYLGGIDLKIRDWELRSFETGYWLRTSVTGQGLMTEAVRVLIRFAFEEMAARRLVITCDSTNSGSAAIPTRLGIPQEAHLRKDRLGPDGTLHDTLLFALTDDDYRAGQGQAP